MRGVEERAVDSIRLVSSMRLRRRGSPTACIIGDLWGGGGKRERDLSCVAVVK